MAKWMMVVETNCSDPSRMAEFSEWYDNVHIPDILESKCMVSGNRYDFVTNWIPGRGPADNAGAPAEKARFLALYEIEADNAVDALNKLDKDMEAKIKVGRWCDAVQVVSMRVFKQVSARRSKI